MPMPCIGRSEIFAVFVCRLSNGKTSIDITNRKDFSWFAVGLICMVKLVKLFSNIVIFPLYIIYNKWGAKLNYFSIFPEHTLFFIKQNKALKLQYHINETFGSRQHILPLFIYDFQQSSIFDRFAHINFFCNFATEYELLPHMFCINNAYTFTHTTKKKRYHMNYPNKNIRRQSLQPCAIWQSTPIRRQNM